MQRKIRKNKFGRPTRKAMPMNLQKWLEPGYDPCEKAAKSKKKKLPRNLPKNYRAFNTQQTMPKETKGDPKGTAEPTSTEEKYPDIYWEGTESTQKDRKMGGQKRSRDEMEDHQEKCDSELKRTKGPWSASSPKKHAGKEKKEIIRNVFL